MDSGSVVMQFIKGKVGYNQHNLVFGQRHFEIHVSILNDKTNPLVGL